LLTKLGKKKTYFEKMKKENKVTSSKSLIKRVEKGEFVIVFFGDFSEGKSIF